MATNIILNVAQFDLLLDQSAGRVISHTPVTKTISNVSGAETLTEGDAVNIKAHFVRTNQKFNFDKAGLVEQGDAILTAKYGDNIQKNDVITVNGEKFRVIERYDVAGVFDSTSSGTTYVYTMCSLFFYE